MLDYDYDHEANSRQRTMRGDMRRHASGQIGLVEFRYSRYFTPIMECQSINHAMLEKEKKRKEKTPMSHPDAAVVECDLPSLTLDARFREKALHAQLGEHCTSSHAFSSFLP